MAEIADAVEMMKSAWTTRRRSFSASGREQEVLINEAHQKLDDAVAICRNAEALPQLAQAIHMLANVEHDMSHDQVAQELWEEAVSICRAVGDNAQLAHKVRHLGDLHRHLGRLDQAETCYEEALALYRRHEDPPTLDFANAVARMASLKEGTLSTEEAVRLWQQACELYEAAGMPAGVEDCSKHIARLKG